MANYKKKPGRPKGRKNLKPVEGGFLNQHGVVFSEEQKKALERAVERSNYRRKKMQEEVVSLRRERDPNNQLLVMGHDSDFILSRQSKSLQRFKSMEEYEKFMDKQAAIQSKDNVYINEKTRHYKRNYKTAIDNVLGKEGQHIKNFINRLPLDEYRVLVEGNEIWELNYVYDPVTRAAKLEQLTNAMEEYREQKKQESRERYNKKRREQRAAKKKVKG